MQGLPADIRNLPQYYVPNQIFIYTILVLLFLLLWPLTMFAIWAWRSHRNIHNYEYIVDYNIRRQFTHAKNSYKEKEQKQIEEENEVFHSQSSRSNSTIYSPELEAEQMSFNRQQSRMLEFLSLSVILVINVNSFTIDALEIAAYFIAVAVFAVFNLFRVLERFKYLRLLFFLPLIVAYLPFLIFKKELKIM